MDDVSSKIQAGPLGRGGLDVERATAGHAVISVELTERDLQFLDRLLTYVETAVAAKQKGSDATSTTALQWLRSDARKLQRRLQGIADAAGMAMDDEFEAG